MPQRLAHFLTFDPRSGQVLALAILLALGLTVFSIGASPTTVVTIVTTALLLEGLFSRNIMQLPSALISGLSLSLLLRTNDISIALLATLIAISSKRILRYRGQHIFNPTAFALVVISTSSAHAWLSPGQWGQSFQLLLLVCIAGLVVTRKAARLDLSATFLCTFGALSFMRAIYLGDPIAIPIHQLSNGALLIFTFFMISDPRTTPSSRGARLIFGILVAGVAAVLQYGFHWSNASIFALVFCAPLVPLLNAHSAGNPLTWMQFAQTQATKQSNGVIHV